MYQELSTQIAALQEELHIHQFGFLTTDKIVFSPEVRELCKANTCGLYGSTWACPPGVGTYEECQKKVLAYPNMFVFTTMHELEDSYDFEGMMAGKDHHNEISEQVLEAFKKINGDKLLALSGEGCTKCKTCTYPDAPCRFPEQLMPSIESYGIMVNRLANTLSINYINGANTVTYFSGICF